LYAIGADRQIETFGLAKPGLICEVPRSHRSSKAGIAIGGPQMDARQSTASRTLFALFAWVALSLGGCMPMHASDLPVTRPGGAFVAAAPTGGVVIEAWAGTPEVVTTTEVETFYRVWGGSARQLGAWLSPTLPTSGASVRSSMALPPQNEALFWCVVTVPAGTRMRTGIAAPNCWT
jgi:hypothetical protein